MTRPLRIEFKGAVYHITSRGYQAFVFSGIKVESPLKAIKGQLFLGQDNFTDEIKQYTTVSKVIKRIEREDEK